MYEEVYVIYFYDWKTDQRTYIDCVYGSKQTAIEALAEYCYLKGWQVEERGDYTYVVRIPEENYNTVRMTAYIKAVNFIR
jgi:hypothetical protein